MLVDWYPLIVNLIWIELWDRVSNSIRIVGIMLILFLPRIVFKMPSKSSKGKQPITELFEKVICPHNKRRIVCVRCKSQGNGGGSICIHSKVRSLCFKCKLLGTGGGGLCLHLKIKSKCRECRYKVESYNGESS
jgi:hypothetical protein